MRRVLLVAVGVSLLATACGTTVPLTSQQAAGTASGVDAGAGFPATDGGSAGPGTDGAVVGSGGAVVGSRGAGIAGGVASGGGTTGAGRSGTSHRRHGWAEPGRCRLGRWQGHAGQDRLHYGARRRRLLRRLRRSRRGRRPSGRHPLGRRLGQPQRRTQRAPARRQDRGGLGDEPGVLRRAVPAAVPEVHAGRQGGRREQHRHRRQPEHGQLHEPRRRRCSSPAPTRCTTSRTTPPRRSSSLPTRLRPRCWPRPSPS